MRRAYVIGLAVGLMMAAYVAPGLASDFQLGLSFMRGGAAADALPGVAPWVNPAEIHGEEEKGLRLQVGALFDDSASLLGQAVTYYDTHSGFGGGALTYASDGQGKSVVGYSVSANVGNAGLGGTVKWISEFSEGVYGLDVGLTLPVNEAIAFGLSLDNAISSGGPSGILEGNLPRQIQAGVALDNGKGFHLSADYIDQDLTITVDPAIVRLGARLEDGGFGVWLGLDYTPATRDKTYGLGASLISDRFVLDWSTRLEGDGQAMSLSLTQRF